MRFQSSTRPRAALFWLILVTAAAAVSMLFAGNAAARAGSCGPYGGYGHHVVHARPYGFGGYGHRYRGFHARGYFGHGPAYYDAPRYHYYPYRSSFSVGVSFGTVPPGGYYYFDPYCDRRFSTLDLYLGHLGRYDHAPIVHVIGLDAGYPAYAYRYDGGRWGYCGY